MSNKKSEDGSRSQNLNKEKVILVIDFPGVDRYPFGIHNTINFKGDHMTGAVEPVKCKRRIHINSLMDAGEIKGLVMDLHPNYTSYHVQK